MARPPTFDRSQILDQALLLFWRKGYQATSMTELLQAMDISRSSFYAAFVDKRSVFVECLDLFAERTQDIVRRARAERAPIDALQYFFERTFVGARSDRADWGCMLVNTVLEMADVDDDLARRASDRLTQMQHLFQHCLEEAGVAPPYATEMAALLMLVNEGIRVSSRRKLTPQQQLAPIDTVFRLLRGATADAASFP